MTDVLDREGTVDMDEREAQWRSEGWSGRYAGDHAPGTTGAMAPGAIGAAASTTTGLGTGAPGPGRHRRGRGGRNGRGGGAGGARHPRHPRPPDQDLPVGVSDRVEIADALPPEIAEAPIPHVI